MRAFGVPAGAKAPNQVLALYGGSPASLNDGTPGSVAARWPSGTAIGLASPDLMRSSTAGEPTGKSRCASPRSNATSAGAAPP